MQPARTALSMSSGRRKVGRFGSFASTRAASAAFRLAASAFVSRSNSRSEVNAASSPNFTPTVRAADRTSTDSLLASFS